MERAVLAPLLLAVALTAIGNAQSFQTDDEPIRTLIKTFADARNAHDGEAVAALYSEDGEWISAHGYFVHGRPALVRLWSGVTGQVARTIQSIDFAGNNIAVVRVVTEYSEPIGRRHEAFILVKGGRTWNIRLHQSVD
jgi:uncharacterized protein (TIGR02246 family)